MTIVTLKKGEGRTLRDGGLWIFDNEIDEIDSSYENGDIVCVNSHEGHFLGYGYINDNSKIRIRILSRNRNNEIDESFFYQRLKDAYNYRKRIMNTNSYRVVFSDADRLPGLVVDRYEDVLVFEFDTLGMDIRKDLIVNKLIQVFKEDGISINKIYERSDARVRTLEGLERVKGFISEPFETNVIIDEYGRKINVDVKEGQKTGIFLDQKDNHYAIRNICRNAKVLDCFTNVGGFALSAAKVAKEVIGVDASELAISNAKENARLNNLNNTRFMVADVFDLLIELEEKNKKFDVIVLDPPAFTKSKNSLKNATKGYKEINYRAMKLLNNGGFLVSCSCSEYMNRDLFIKTILSAGNDAHKRIKIIENRSQSPDHPIILGNNVTDYLKCIIMQINER